MHSKILYTAGSIVALLVVLTIFFSIRPEGFLRRGEAAVTQAEVEAAGAAVSFTGKKAGADLENVVYAFDDGWYKEHSGQILLIRLGVVAGIIVAGAVLWAFGDGLLKRKFWIKKHTSPH